MLDAVSRKNIGKFEIRATSGSARQGALFTASGVVETPAFMPVGTQASVKAVSPRELKEIGAQIILSNTYHLHLRPGDELIRDLGGLHQFMGWTGPILTDSGGFQVYSLSQLRKVDATGVEFRSHHDGALVRFTPQKVIAIQENLDVDIMMVLDECVGHDASLDQALQALERTSRWAAMSLESRKDPARLMFGIVQGGMFESLRERSAQELTGLAFDGFAIGGLSVGESKKAMHHLTEFTARLLPEERPRYLMGVGMPEDIFHAVNSGVDMFDCVIPTRSARFGRIFVGNTYINIRNSAYRRDETALDKNCDCYACKNFSRAYLSHLIHSQEILGIQLATLHNLRYYQRMMSEIRRSISESRFADFYRSFMGAGLDDSQGVVSDVDDSSSSESRSEESVPEGSIGEMLCSRRDLEV